MILPQIQHFGCYNPIIHDTDLWPQAFSTACHFLNCNKFEELRCVNSQYIEDIEKQISYIADENTHLGCLGTINVYGKTIDVYKMDDLVIGTRIFIRDRDITIPYFNMIRNGTDEYCVQ